MTDIVLNIDMDKKCAECGKGGATDSGICLNCLARAMNPLHKMRSRQGAVVQARCAKIFPNWGQDKCPTP